MTASEDLFNKAGAKRFKTVLADPPWQFQNRTGKVAPEHKRLNRYSTMTLPEICTLPVAQICDDTAHPDIVNIWIFKFVTICN